MAKKYRADGTLVCLQRKRMDHADGSDSAPRIPCRYRLERRAAAELRHAARAHRREDAAGHGPHPAVAVGAPSWIGARLRPAHVAKVARGPDRLRRSFPNFRVRKKTQPWTHPSVTTTRQRNSPSLQALRRPQSGGTNWPRRICGAARGQSAAAVADAQPDQRAPVSSPRRRRRQDRGTESAMEVDAA